MAPRIVECLRCGKAWATYREHPVRCRWCRTPYWDKVRHGQGNSGREVVAGAAREVHRAKERGEGNSGVRQRKAAVCAHGTPKGYNCWKCGGIAVIE